MFFLFRFEFATGVIDGFKGTRVTRMRLFLRRFSLDGLEHALDSSTQLNLDACFRFCP